MPIFGNIFRSICVSSEVHCILLCIRGGDNRACERWPQKTLALDKLPVTLNGVSALMCTFGPADPHDDVSSCPICRQAGAKAFARSLATPG